MGSLIGLGWLLVIYLLWIRPWQLQWGAIDEEVARPMPGDDLVASPTFNATRAVTVMARPEEIFPWIAQLGFDRAGWYSYDWIDNLGRPSANVILPQFQGLRAGDLIPLYREMGFRVREIEPPRYMLWVSTDSSWCWGLYPAADGSTRLITRVRLTYRWLSPSILFSPILDAGEIIMMRKCMLGIKERAEALHKAAA